MNSLRFSGTAVVLVLLALGSAQRSGAQSPTSAIHVRVHAAGNPVERARVRAGGTSALTDSAGTATLRVPSGPTVVSVRKLGFVPDTIAVSLAPGADTTLTVELNPTATSLTGVVVTS